MWMKFIVLIGIIFILHQASPLAFAVQANPVGDDRLSSQLLRSGVSQPGTIQTNENATTVMITDHAGPRSDRRRRAATTDAGNATQSLAAAPLNLVRSLLAFALSILEVVINWGRVILWNLTAAVSSQSWKFMKNFIIPEVDEICMKFLTVEAVPQNIKDMITSAHAAYAVMKLFGYLRPT